MTRVIEHNSVIEPSRTIPVREAVDVIVAGGGLGGTAAALASARAGARTLLVERNSFLGGVATAGMCCSIFNCFYTRNRKLGTTGIAVEVADALAKATGYGRRWHRHKGHIIYDIEQAKLVLQHLLKQSGARSMLQAVIAGVVIEGDTLRGVIVETKSGREAILAKVVVDATGDADIAAHCAAPVLTNQSSKHSLCFRLGNVDVDAFVDYFRDHPDQYPEYMDVEWTLQEALAQYDDCGTLLFPHGGGMQMELLKRARANGDLPDQIGSHNTLDACQMHALRHTGIVHVVTGFTVFDGLDVALINEGITSGRQMTFAVARVLREYIPGFADAFVVGTAANLGVRTSRWIAGDLVMTRAMAQPGVRFEDAVGRAVGNNHETRHRGENAWGVQAMHPDSFDLPYRCLLPKDVDGLIMGAGRSVSAETPWLLRVMVHTMMVGQAAGAAAAVAARAEATPRNVDLAVLQAELGRQGVDLDQ